MWRGGSSYSDLYVLNYKANCNKPQGLMSALLYVYMGSTVSWTPCSVFISRVWAECPWMRSLKPPCMCMSRLYIVPISSSASTTSGSRISCVMWLFWWRARSSVATGLCWLPVVNISFRHWWVKWRMAWLLAFQKRYVPQTCNVPESHLTCIFMKAKITLCTLSAMSTHIYCFKALTVSNPAKRVIDN